jgi:beta-lactamase regulating signal transducer with metallopeptidase domain
VLTTGTAVNTNTVSVTTVPVIDTTAAAGAGGDNTAAIAVLATLLAVFVLLCLFLLIYFLYIKPRRDAQRRQQLADKQGYNNSAYDLTDLATNDTLVKVSHPPGQSLDN